MSRKFEPACSNGRDIQDQRSRLTCAECGETVLWLVKLAGRWVCLDCGGA